MCSCSSGGDHAMGSYNSGKRASPAMCVYPYSCVLAWSLPIVYDAFGRRSITDVSAYSAVNNTASNLVLKTFLPLRPLIHYVAHDEDPQPGT